MIAQREADIASTHGDCWWRVAEGGLIVMGCGSSAPAAYPGLSFRDAHLIEMIHEHMNKEASMDAVTVKPARIEDLIDHLRSLPEGTPVPFLAYSGDSYRGYYERFALAPGEGEARSVADYLEEDVIGKTFTGYKGGDFTMDARTIVHCNEYGSSSGADLVGICSDGRIVFIEDVY